jgi:hypothetical protein
MLKGMIAKLGISAVAIYAAVTGGILSSCASGGFKLTRQIAQMVNSQQLIVRVIIYILAGALIFGITLLIDMVIFNTMDFWEGRVSANTYEFEKDGKTFVAHHRYQEGTQLKESHLQVFDADKKLLQDVIIRETAALEVELFVDGVLKAKAQDLMSLPKIISYNDSGNTEILLASTFSLIASR